MSGLIDDSAARDDRSDESDVDEFGAAVKEHKNDESDDENDVDDSSEEDEDEDEDEDEIRKV